MRAPPSTISISLCGYFDIYTSKPGRESDRRVKQQRILLSHLQQGEGVIQ